MNPKVVNFQLPTTDQVSVAVDSVRMPENVLMLWECSRGCASDIRIGGRGATVSGGAHRLLVLTRTIEPASTLDSPRARSARRVTDSRSYGALRAQVKKARHRATASGLIGR